VGPTQKVRRCRTFWIEQVKLLNSNDSTSGKPFTVKQSQIATEPIQQSRSVVCSGLPVLFKFDDLLADPPVGFGKVFVDGLIRSPLASNVSG